MAGLPQAWVALEEAITYHAKQMVAWSIGREVREFRGGWQKNGERSRLATKSILAIKGTGAGAHLHAPGLTNSMLFARDRQLCAYCGAAPAAARPLARPCHPGLPRRARHLDQRRDRLPQLQHPQGRAYARAGAHAAAVRALRTQPARALHPAQPPHPRRPDGIPAGRRAAQQPAARGRGHRWRSRRPPLSADPAARPGAAAIVAALRRFVLRCCVACRRIANPRDAGPARRRPTTITISGVRQC